LSIVPIENNMKAFLSIYKSPKKEGMYIYLKKEQGISQVPETLAQLFGEPILVTHMMVDENKKFAKVKAIDLLNSINEKGFYLQMPDPDPEYKRFMIASNDKLK